MAEIRLGISREDIERIENNLCGAFDVDNIDEIANFTRGVTYRMFNEQGKLHEYLANCGRRFTINSPLAFAYSTALSYEVVPEKVRGIPMTQDTINAVNRSLQENMEEGGLDLDWLIDYLKSDSPDYLSWLGNVTSSLNIRDDKVDFILGSSIVIAAFYLQADSRILDASL